MTPDEYQQGVSGVTVPALVLAGELLSSMGPGPLSESGWLAFLKALYPTVREQAWQAARLGRLFYESQREEQFPGIPRNDVRLPTLGFERFVRDMEPVRELTRKSGFSAELVSLRVARSVENGARRAVIHAVSEPDDALDEFVVERYRKPPGGASGSGGVTNIVKGWARVPTGAETCGWCWMLASRGPVYGSAGTAGARGTDAAVVRKTADGSMSESDMNQWHSGCDCKVVPVFRLDSWAGKDKADAAWDLWHSEITGKYFGKEAVNKFRQLVEAGAIQEILGGRRAA